jgi:hypothetical protein
MNQEQKENLKHLQNYLEGMLEFLKGQKAAVYYKLLLEKGEVFTDLMLAKHSPISKDWKKLRRPKIKQCYYNSQMFLLHAHSDCGVKYYEGFCHEGLIPYQHGWNILDNKVLDFTMEVKNTTLARRKVNCDRTLPVYIGVEVPCKTVMMHLATKGISEPIAHIYCA